MTKSIIYRIDGPDGSERANAIAGLLGGSRARANQRAAHEAREAAALLAAAARGAEPIAEVLLEEPSLVRLEKRLHWAIAGPRGAYLNEGSARLHSDVAQALGVDPVRRLEQPQVVDSARVRAPDDELRAVRAGLVRVKALHAPCVGVHGETVCSHRHCVDDSGDQCAYPCETVRATVAPVEDDYEAVPEGE